jgi:hypothetical protein
MTAAIFGLVGVLVGAFIAGLAAYFMERRTGWLAARAAALLTIEDLEDAKAELSRADSDVSLVKQTIDRVLKGWEERREALLYRKGTSPSGITAAQWLNLGSRFRQLRPLDKPEDDRDREKVITDILDVLKVFEEDGHALPRVARNVLGIDRKPTTKESA